MSSFSRTSLGFKLLSAFIIIIVVVLTAITVFSILHERAKARQELMGKGEILAGMLSFSSRIGVYAESRDALKDAAAGMVSEPDVVFVGIYNADFKPLYVVDKGPAGKAASLDSGPDAPPVRETESTLEFTKPVLLTLNPNEAETLYFGEKDAAAPTKTIGYVSIVLDKKLLNQEVLGILARNAFMALMFISASVVVVYLSVRKITRPLATLTTSVKALGRGGDIAPIPVTTMDEIGKLSTAFNAMVEERAGAEHALRESEKKYRELFEEAINPVFISTPRGEIIDMNRAGVEFFGCADKEELLALNIQQDLYAHPEDREVFKRIMERSGSVKNFEVQLNTKNGEPRSVVISATAVRDKAGVITAYRGMLRDVTTERSLEEQLRHAQKMEAVGRLTGGVAHDFNNILTAIVSYAYHLQIKLAKTEDPLGVYAENIIVAGEKAAGLIRSLLIFSRKQMLNPRPVDLNEIVRGHTDILARLISDDIELATRLRDDPMIINADRGQIELMLMNFVSNARDAMPDGGRIVIKTDKVHFTEEGAGVPCPCKPGEYAALSVADTGVGMDAATQQKIFEPFFTTKEQGKGTGLGLSLVYGIVKQHNGHIDVASEPLQGTTFTVYLPLQDVATPLVASDDKPPRAKGGEAILIAEDGEEEREFVGSVLGDFGYRIVKAADGEEALRKFYEQGDAVNLLLLDMVMPLKNGMQVYVEAKKSRPDLKAIFITGYPADRYDLGGHDDVDLHFLIKPVSPRQLLQKVREVLDS